MHPQQLQAALQELGQVLKYAQEDHLPIPSNIALNNAEYLTKTMFQISPRRFAVYPIPDGIAIDTRGSNNNILVVLCGSSGSILCLRTIHGQSERARYQDINILPNDFMHKTLHDL